MIRSTNLSVVYVTYWKFVENYVTLEDFHKVSLRALSEK